MVKIKAFIGSCLQHTKRGKILVKWKQTVLMSPTPYNQFKQSPLIKILIIVTGSYPEKKPESVCNDHRTLFRDFIPCILRFQFVEGQQELVHHCYALMMH